MDVKILLIILFVAFCGFNYQTTGNDVTDDEIDSLIKRLASVLETQTLEERESEDFAELLDDALERGRMKKKKLSKKWWRCHRCGQDKQHRGFKKNLKFLGPSKN